MNSIFNIVLVNLLILPVMVYRNFQLSEEILGNEGINELLQVNIRMRKILLLNTNLPLNWLGLTYHILVSITSLLITVILGMLSVVAIIILLFDVTMTWFSPEILVIFGLCVIGYSFLLFLVFSFISWMNRK